MPCDPKFRRLLIVIYARKITYGWARLCLTLPGPFFFEKKTGSGGDPLLIISL